MRPSLLHPLGEARHSRRHRRGRGAAAVEPARESAPVEPVREPAPATADLAVARAREAGGPIDRASYKLPVRLRVLRAGVHDRRLPPLRRRAGLVATHERRRPRRSGVFAHSSVGG